MVENNKKFLDLLKRVTGKNYNNSEKLKITSAKKAALESLCKKNGVYINLNALKDGCNSIICQDKNYKSGIGDKLFINEEELEDISDINLGLQIGCDIQSILEFKKLITDNNFYKCSFINSVFTKNEISEIETRDNKIESLCGIFAAKEAIIKTGKLNNFNEIEISYIKKKPFVKGFSISISHSKEFAMAVAITSK